MSQMLSIFLKNCRKNNHTKLIALVKEDNVASRKLIRANHFVQINKIKDVDCYICDLENNDNMQKAYNEIKHKL